MIRDNYKKIQMISLSLTVIASKSPGLYFVAILPHAKGLH